MKNTRFIFICLSVCTTCISFSQQDAQTLLQSNYDKVSRLSLKKDTTRLEMLAKKNASSSFEYIDAMRNTMDLAATIRQNNEQLVRVRKFNSTSNKIIGVKSHGKDLICTVKTTYDLFLDSAGKNRIIGTSVSQDTWINTLTGWKLRKSKVVKETTSQNGTALH